LPIYEYGCAKCGARIEKIQKFSDPPLVRCKRCGGKLERLLSPPAIQFKGSGWYVTDYARKAAPAEDSSASKGDGHPKSEGKPSATGTVRSSANTKSSSDK
jgi:putative FmdB family regulatory protein